MGSQIWAAKFQSLDVKYTTGCQADPDGCVKLLNVFSARSYRGGESEVAQISVQCNSAASETTNSDSVVDEGHKQLSSEEHWNELEGEISTLEIS